MPKKVLILAIILLLAGGATYYYLHLKKEEKPVSNAVKAIPIDASFILECKKSFPLWKEISQNNEIWKDLTVIPYFEMLDEKTKALDSLISDNTRVSKILENQSLFISAHPDGLNKFNYLFICNLPPGGQWAAGSGQFDVEAFLNSLTVKNSENDIAYEESIIHCILKNGKPYFYYAFKDGIFISSFSSSLIKESLRQLASGISLLNNTYFIKVLNASGSRSVASFFFNFQTFATVASHLMDKEFQPHLSGMQNFAQWMGLDVSVQSDEVIMTGFTDCDTATNQFISLFQRQTPREIRTTSVAPANTVFMVCHDFSDYSRFSNDFKLYLGSRDNLKQRTEWVNSIAKKHDISMEKYFYPWVGNEVSLVITESPDNSFDNNTYILVNTNDMQLALKDLGIIGDSVSNVVETRHTLSPPHALSAHPDSEYMHHSIHNLGLDNLTSHLLGSSFAGVSKSWYAGIGNFIVFANSKSALKMLIYKYEGGNTLEKNTYYMDYIKQHVENESSIYIYNNVALSQEFYSGYIDKSYSADMKKYKDAFSKLQAVSMQFHYLQGMFYTNFYLKRNASFQKEISPIWQVALDTTLEVPPCWVTDISLQMKYVMAEDKNSTLYFINNDGIKEWKTKIEGPIMSSVFQVDALKNKKSQYLFNTSRSIVLLDRKGNTLDGFPMKLKYTATAPIKVFDYDNNRNYRLLLAGTSNPLMGAKGVIYEYDIHGKPVKDWKVPKTKEIVKCAPLYCRIDQKDYLIFVDDAGKVYAFDRKGNEKLNLDNRLPSRLKHFYIAQGKSLTDSYIMAADSFGTIFRLSLSGELSTINYLKSKCNNTDFILLQGESNGKPTGKEDMLFLCGKSIYAYNSDKSEIFHATAKSELNNRLLYFTYPDHPLAIGAIDDKNQGIYLWDNTGRLLPGFPILGSGGFSITEMKTDGSLYLVTGADNKVYVYGLP